MNSSFDIDFLFESIDINFVIYVNLINLNTSIIFVKNKYDTRLHDDR